MRTESRRRAIIGALCVMALGHAGRASAQAPLAPVATPPAAFPAIAGLTGQYGDFRGVFQSLTDPAVVPAARMTELGDAEEVLGITLGGMSRAYPARFIAWHHIVNDTLGGPSRSPIAASATAASRMTP